MPPRNEFGHEYINFGFQSLGKNNFLFIQQLEQRLTLPNPHVCVTLSAIIYLVLLRMPVEGGVLLGDSKTAALTN